MKSIGIGSEFGLSRSSGYGLNCHANPSLRSNALVTLTSNGRASLALAARFALETADTKRHTVLLPAYLCHSMIQPFLELGLKVRFYPVTNDLRINSSAILQRIDDSTLAVMLMHYFGFPQSEEIIELLTKEFPKLTIIDDRTHLLLSDMKVGLITSNSAITIHSPRKWGPFPDLGIVVWPNSNHPTVVSNKLIDKGLDWSFGLWRLSGLFLRTLFFAWPIERFRPLSLLPFHKADALLNQRVKIRHASPISQILWRWWDWVSAWQVRRENYQYLLDNWPSIDMKPVFPKLPESVCPLGFPIRTTRRDKVKQFLIGKQIFPPVHWVRPTQVSSQEFPIAAALADQELTIPIDQRYGLRHMDFILETLCHA